MEKKKEEEGDVKGKEKKITIQQCVPGEKHPDSGLVRTSAHALIILSCI